MGPTFRTRSFRLSSRVLGTLALSWLLSSCSTPTESTGQVALSMAAKVSSAQPNHEGSLITATFTDTVTPATFKDLRVLINTDVDGRKACYIYFDPAANLLSLTKDAGEGAEHIPIGAAASLSNSQCRLDSNASSFSKSGNTHTLTLGLAFLPSFTGDKNVYLYAETAAGAVTGFVKATTWEIL